MALKRLFAERQAERLLLCKHSINHKSRNMNTDWLAKWAVYSPDKVAAKEYETQRTMTYGQLDAASNRVSRHWTEVYGLQAGDRVAIIAENCLEYLVLIGVAQKTGCILVPLNYRLATAEIDYLIQDAAPRLMITAPAFRELVAGSAHFQGVAHHLSLEEVLTAAAAQEGSPYPSIALHPEDPAFILYTSGTTGFPKGALYTHQMLFWNSINTAMSLIVNSESRTVNCMPPFHTGGLNVLMTPFLHHGGYTCLMQKFDADAVMAALDTEAVTLFMGVPTMLKMMADSPAFEAAQLEALHYIIVGGEPMPIPLIETWHGKGVPIRQGYGMTEVGPNLTSLHHDDAIRKQGSIGRPNFYVNIRIVRPDGSPCDVDEPGELLLYGDMVTTGYWQNPAATDKAFAGSWFKTGDRVRQDAEGYLYVVDRIKNMFISGGENVYPAEVERVLIAHPAIAEVAVIGIPHEKWGEVGKAVVVLRDADVNLTIEEIKAFCTQQLSKFKIPKALEIVSALPKTASGKIDRKAMK